MIKAVVASAALLLSLAVVQSAEARNAPGGSYLRTCTDVRVHGNRLTATCRRVDGRWHRTNLHALHRCRGDIANINGNLTCGGRNFGERRHHRRDGYGSSWRDRHEYRHYYYGR